MDDTRAREVRVTVKRSVSDGNYGTASAEVTLQAWMTDEDGDDDMVDTDLEAAKAMMGVARTIIMEHLAHDPNPRVRQAAKIGTEVMARPAFPAEEPDYVEDSY